MIVPACPTATPIFELIKQTSWRVFPCGKGFCQNHCAFEFPEAIISNEKSKNAKSKICFIISSK